MIMRFNFEAEVVVVVEPDHPGVVFEDADAPWKVELGSCEHNG